MNIERAQEITGHVFKDRAVIRAALTHPSVSALTGAENYDRLEFLGDSILGFVVAEYLYRSYPDHPEGDLTRMRADLVCETSLAQVAARLELGKHLLLGHGEEQGGAQHDSGGAGDELCSVFLHVDLLLFLIPALEKGVVSNDTAPLPFMHY